MGGEQQVNWDVVIAPDRPWWKLDLKEIWAYRDLLMLLVRRDLVAIYKQTLLGPAWQVLQPLLTSIMFAVVFGILARMSLPGMPPLLFYLSGVVPWMYFANVINRTSQTLLWNSALMTKVYFPRLIAPLSTTLSTGVSFGVQLLSFFVFALFYRFSGMYAWSPDASLLMLPVLTAVSVLLAFGTGLVVAALTTRFRDLSFLIGFMVQLAMYASPVIFPLSMTTPGSKIRLLLELNPMTPVIEGFRAALVGTPMEWVTLTYSAGVGLIMLFIGLAMFQRVERSFADII
jgi:lipopolysaccharide transport system permease protein